MKTDKELIERLRSPVAEQGDPKAVYRTRPVALFEEAASRLEALSSGEAVKHATRIGFLAECDENNAVVFAETSSEEMPYWTLIAQGGAGTQTAVAEEVCRRWNALSRPMPSREEVERALAAKLEEVGGSYLSIDQAADAFGGLFAENAKKSEAEHEGGR